MERKGEFTAVVRLGFAFLSPTYAGSRPYWLVYLELEPMATMAIERLAGIEPEQMAELRGLRTWYRK